MAITTSEGARFSISINNTPKNKTLKKIGSILKKVFEDFGSDIKLISNNKIKLNDGTLAYKTVIDWRFKSNFYLRNIVLSVFKNNKWITLNYSFDSLNKSVEPFYKKDHNYLVNSFNF
jgi:hypothetical protein